MSAAVVSPMWYAPVSRARHIALTTYRRSGEAVTAPVWFAMQADRLYVFTLPDSGKVKRLRHTSRVLIAACTMGGKITGPAVRAEARFVTEPDEIQRARRALWGRYRLPMLGLRLLTVIQSMMGRPPAQNIYLALETPPMQE